MSVFDTPSSIFDRPSSIFDRPESDIDRKLRMHSQPGSVMPGDVPLGDQSIMAFLGSGLLSGAGAVGEYIDKQTGARGLRGLLGGHPEELLSIIPGSDTFGLTDRANIVSGKDLTGYDDPDAYMDDWLGTGVEMLLDPTLALTFGTGGAVSGAGKLLKAAGVSGQQVMKAAAAKAAAQRALGLSDDVFEQALTAQARAADPTRSLVQSWITDPVQKALSQSSPGYFESQISTTLADVLNYLPDTRPAIEATAARRGVDITNEALLNQPTAGMFGVGVPFMDPSAVFGTGKTAQSVARGLDAAGSSIYNAFPGKNPLPVLGSLFNPEYRGTMTPEVQSLSAEGFRAEEDAVYQANLTVADLFRRLDRSGYFKGEDGMRNQLDFVAYVENAARPGGRVLPDDARAVADEMRVLLPKMVQDERAAGLISPELADTFLVPDPNSATGEMIERRLDYLPRMPHKWPDEPPTSLGSTRPVDTTNPFTAHREDYLRGMPEGTALIQEMSLDPEVSGLISRKLSRNSVVPNDVRQRVEAVVRRKYGPQYDELGIEIPGSNRLGAYIGQPSEMRQLVDLLVSLDPRHAKQQQPFFTDPLKSLQARYVASNRAVAHANVAHDALLSNLKRSDEATFREPTRDLWRSLEIFPGVDPVNMGRRIETSLMRNAEQAGTLADFQAMQAAAAQGIDEARAIREGLDLAKAEKRRIPKDLFDSNGNLTILPPTSVSQPMPTISGGGQGTFAPWGMTPQDFAQQGVQVFRTSQGSLYAFDGKQTVRIKPPHQGHAATDIGPKSASLETVFVDPADAQKAGMWGSLQANGKRLVVQGDEILLTSINSATGQRGIDDRLKIASRAPVAGLAPLELLESSSQGAGWYRSSHPGNEITAFETPDAFFSELSPYLAPAPTPAGTAIQIPPELEPYIARARDEQRLKPLLSSYAVPRRLVDDATQMLGKWQMPPAVGWLEDGSRRALNMFKLGVTSLFPAFHARNYPSGQFNNIATGAYTGVGDFLSDTNIASAVMTGRTPPGVAKLFEAQFGPGLSDDDTMDVLRNHVFAGGLLDMGSSLGMADVGGQAAPRMLDILSKDNPLTPFGGFAFDPTRTWMQANPLNPFTMRGVGTSEDLNWYSRGMNQFGSYVEGQNRIAPFLGFLKQGLEPMEASRRAKRAQVDYNRFSDFEKRFMTQLFPFYKYTRGMGPFVAEELFAHPSGFMGQSVRETGRLQRDNEFVPESIASTTAIPLGTDEEGNQRYLTGLGLPYEQPLGLIRPGVDSYDTAQNFFGGVLGMLNPYVKLPIELATGTQLFSGRDLEDLDSTVGRIATNVGITENPPDVPILVDEVLANSPVARLLTTTRQATDQRKWDPMGAAGLLTGLKQTDVDPERAQRDAARSALEKLLRSDPAIFQGRPELYVRDLSLLTPQERALYQLLGGYYQ